MVWVGFIVVLKTIPLSLGISKIIVEPIGVCSKNQSSDDIQHCFYTSVYIEHDRAPWIHFRLLGINYFDYYQYSLSRYIFLSNHLALEEPFQ